jgi:hypothetical protein
MYLSKVGRQKGGPNALDCRRTGLGLGWESWGGGAGAGRGRPDVPLQGGASRLDWARTAAGPGLDRGWTGALDEWAWLSALERGPAFARIALEKAAASRPQTQTQTHPLRPTHHPPGRAGAAGGHQGAGGRHGRQGGGSRGGGGATVREWVSADCRGLEAAIRPALTRAPRATPAPGVGGGGGARQAGQDHVPGEPGGRPGGCTFAEGLLSTRLGPKAASPGTRGHPHAMRQTQQGQHPPAA